MSKQVEVPEGVMAEAVTRVLDRHNVREQEDRILSPRLAVADDLEAALPYLLPALYKHFTDRLLSDEAVEVVARRRGARKRGLVADGVREAVRADLEAALQATSTPQEEARK